MSVEVSHKQDWQFEAYALAFCLGEYDYLLAAWVFICVGQGMACSMQPLSKSRVTSTAAFSKDYSITFVHIA
jgi:hypothetical protein